MRHHCRVVTLTALLALVGAVSAFAQNLSLAPCALEGVGPARCGTFQVPEDRARPAGRRIALHVVVLPATGSGPAAEPLVFLAGGGVLPATRLAPFLHRVLPELRRQRDILLVDQRGTGRSNPLSCELRLPRPQGDMVDTARIMQITRDCVRELLAKADLPHYTTTAAMRDLDAVREALGYSRVNIWGVSYGTKAAREYARLFPDRVRALVLHGVVPRDFGWWYDAPAMADRGLDSLDAGCARDSACRARFGPVRRLLDSMIVVAERTTPRVILPRPGQPDMADTVTIDGGTVRNVVYTMLYESVYSRRLPLVAWLALQGDWEPLARWAVPPPGPPAIPRGIFFNIVCSEQMAVGWPAVIKRSAFFGTAGVAGQRAVCEAWPRFPIDPDLLKEFPIAAPTLVLSGAHDHVTPPELGDRLMPGLRNGRHLVLPGRGHNDADRCLTALIERFVESPDVRSLEAGCAAEPPRVAFAMSKEELAGR